jgi:hypothetical protein
VDELARLLAEPAGGREHAAAGMYGADRLVQQVGQSGIRAVR